ncbi:MAG: metallophosphoesterase [Planctomycetota bacterium]
MREVLARLRGRSHPRRLVDFRRAGWAKYLSCTLSGVAAGLLTARISILLALPAAGLAFYLVEGRNVFLFPLLAEFGPRGRRTQAAAVRRAGGLLRVVATVTPIAATMLLGGVRGRGLVRPWLRGCLAIVLWYDDVRARRATAPPLLELGARLPLAVRRVPLRSHQPDAPVRVLWASDLHLGALAARSVRSDLLRVVIRERPHALILGGDLVDSPRGFRELDELLPTLARWTRLVALPGNHDVVAGVERIRRSVLDAGGHWLPDAPLLLDGVRLGVRADADATTRGRFDVLCAHDPADFSSLPEDAHDLALAGHLHGGQVVLGTVGEREMPGGLVYRWNGREFRRGRTTILISRGCADTLPIRFRCPREVILCEIA